MSIASGSQLTFLEAVSQLAYCNPFSSERIRLERIVLGERFREGEPAWSLSVDDPAGPLKNGERIARQVAELLPGLRERARNRNTNSRGVYEGAVLYHLYYSYSRKIYRDPEELESGHNTRADGHSYEDYVGEWNHYFSGSIEPTDSAAHVFAIFYQMRRAFFAIYSNIVGESPSAARLRETIWQSIFTHDMRRYRQGLFRRMGDFSTLITGPSGTGKEFVARAIAYSRYIPFQPRTLTFQVDPEEGFFAVNLAALSPSLIESELFGHRRGAFTGAASDRKGWLEVCPSHGTVFLDEIGDLEPTLQVKLLRVIQTRSFQRVGETESREFHGKIIAATNRNLGDAIRQGKFREDFYYRICSDLVETVPLAEQLAENPEILRQLVRFLSKRVAPEAFEEIALEAEAWIKGNLGVAYSWPGNYRELEQCIRNILLRGRYQPVATAAADTFVDRLRSGKVEAEELLNEYCGIVYSQTGSYAETARRLKLDQRTVKAKVSKARRST